MSSFLQFVLDNQLPIAKDVKKPWFKKVWMPLTMRQIIDQNELMRHSQLTTPTITITSEILNFLGYEGAPKNQQQNLERLLDRAEIIVMEPVCDDANGIHTWNRFKKEWLKKRDYMGNNFILPDSARDEFARLFGIQTWFACEWVSTNWKGDEHFQFFTGHNNTLDNAANFR